MANRKSLAGNIKGGLDGLIGEVDQPGKPTVKERLITKSSQEGTKEGETRATFIVKESSLEKLKNLAYWERVSIKELVNGMIEEYLNAYEKKSGAIKPKVVGKSK